MESLYYLALGDSYSIGTSIASQEAFPHQLADRLTNNINVPVEVKIVARNAWRTDDLIRAIRRTELRDEYDFVTLLIGVNNQYQKLPLDVFRDDYIKLLEQALKYVRGDKRRVFALSIPNYGYSPFGSENKTEITEEIKEFNKSIEEVCQQYDVAYYDVTSISEKYSVNESYIAKDNLHPNALQYSAWLDSFYAKLLEQLGIEGT